MKEEAYLTLARSCSNNNEREASIAYYSKLLNSTNGEYNGEARCSTIEDLMAKKRYDQAEKMIEEVVSDATSDYWLAYAFILWADIYYARGNNLQAKQTLQSIIDNYDGDDLVSVATQKKALIEAEENKPANEEDEEVVIEL